MLCVELQSHYQKVFPLSIAFLIDLTVDSLKMASYYAAQLNPVAISSEDKTKLFYCTKDYPEMSTTTWFIMLNSFIILNQSLICNFQKS